MKRAVCEGASSGIYLILPLFCRRGMQTGVRISFEYLKVFRLPLTTTHCVFIIFATFKITPRMFKMLYLHILQADSTENWNTFCKLIVLDNNKISKKSKKSVLRYIENITGSVGNFVKCMYLVYKIRKACVFAFFLDQVLLYEPRSEKTGLRGFRPGPTQTGLYSHRRWLEA